MVNRLADINRRSYRTKAESLLESLGLRNYETKQTLKDIIGVRDSITHMGKFTNIDSDEQKVGKTYLNLFVLLTKIFLKILPADDTFLKEYNNVKWKLLT